MTRWLTRPDRGGCDVAGCDDPAAGSYLHSSHGDPVEFAVCAAHVARMRAGTRPVVRFEDGADGRRATLVLE